MFFKRTRRETEARGISEIVDYNFFWSRNRAYMIKVLCEQTCELDRWIKLVIGLFV